MGFWMTLLTWVLEKADRFLQRNAWRQCGGVRGRGLRCSEDDHA